MHPAIIKLLAVIMAAGLFYMGYSHIKEFIYHNKMNKDIAFYIQEDKLQVKKQINLLLGSSSILNLKPKNHLNCGEWLNRGLGSSHISNIISYLNSTVLIIKPRLIIIYAGENDLSNGKTIDSVYKDYIKLLTLINQLYPLSKIYIISIKNSPKRKRAWNSFTEFNQLIYELSLVKERITFFNVNDTLDHSNKSQHYLKDGIHLTSRGYYLFTKGINTACKRK